MRKLILLLLTTAFIISCEKENDTQKKQSVPPTQIIKPVVPPKNGDVIFYTKAYPFAYYGSGVDVWIDWGTLSEKYLGKITNAPNFIPSCGSWWGKNFSDVDGASHTYRAKLDGKPTKIWEGSFVIVSDSCIKIGMTNE